MLHKPLFRFDDLVHEGALERPSRIFAVKYYPHLWCRGDGFGYSTTRDGECTAGFTTFKEGRRIFRYLNLEDSQRFGM
jgi:hypothetical protein